MIATREEIKQIKVKSSLHRYVKTSASSLGVSMSRLVELSVREYMKRCKEILDEDYK